MFSVDNLTDIDQGGCLGLVLTPNTPSGCIPIHGGPQNSCFGDRAYAKDVTWNSTKTVRISSCKDDLVSGLAQSPLILVGYAVTKQLIRMSQLAKST